METEKDQLFEWTEDERKFEWQAAVARGKDAFQAYWEAEYMQAVQSKAPGPTIDGIKYILKTQFKEWQEKQESKVEINHTQNLSDEQLNEQIARTMRRLNKAKPELTVVDSGKESNSNSK